jgi:hypothetical protein
MELAAADGKRLLKIEAVANIYHTYSTNHEGKVERGCLTLVL